MIAPFTRLIEAIKKNFLGKASKNLVRKNYSKNTRDWKVRPCYRISILKNAENFKIATTSILGLKSLGGGHLSRDVKRRHECVVPSSFLSSKSCFHDPVRFNELLQAREKSVWNRVRLDECWKPDFFRRFFHSVQFPREEKTRNAYASLIVTHGEGTSFFVDLRSSSLLVISSKLRTIGFLREYYGRNF